MFKKVSHILFAFLLLFSTTGFAISKHYCGDNLISITVFTEADTCCDSGSCCHNETKAYQLDEDFSVASGVEIPETFQIDLLAISLFVLHITTEVNENIDEFVLSTSPPPLTIQTILAKSQTYLL